MTHLSVKWINRLSALMLVLIATNAWADDQKLITTKAAKNLAEQAVKESVVTLKLRATDKVENLVATPMTIEAKSTVIKGINFTDIVYNPARDIAKVTAELPVNRVRNLVGGNIRYGKMIIKRVAFASSSPDMDAPLKALREAELDAYKQLATKIVGLKLADNTSMEDHILNSDTVRAKVLAAIWGAELASYRWDNKGNAYVNLRLKNGIVEDIVGQRIDHRGESIEVKGTGAQHGDFAGTTPKSTSGSSTRVNSSRTEGKLNIPATSLPAMGRENIPGGGFQPRD